MTIGIETLYKSIQEFLTKPPVIIWGAGATVAYGVKLWKQMSGSLAARIVGAGEASSEVRTKCVRRNGAIA